MLGCVVKPVPWVVPDPSLLMEWAVGGSMWSAALLVLSTSTGTLWSTKMSQLLDYDACTELVFGGPLLAVEQPHGPAALSGLFGTVPVYSIRPRCTGWYLCVAFSRRYSIRPRWHLH